MRVTLEEKLKEINNSTLHNMRFLLEAYSEEVLQALDEHIDTMEKKNKEPLQQIHKEVKAVIQTLRGIETVIIHAKHIHYKESNL